MEAISNWQLKLRESLANGTFVKLSLGNYKGAEAGLKNIYAKRVIIKREEKLSFTYRYQTKDITKNYAIDELPGLLKTLIAEAGFRLANLFTVEHDFVLELNHKGIWAMRTSKASHAEIPSLEHDKIKQRKILAEHKPYLHALNITDAEGQVYKNAQDKYKQINHYIEILSAHLKELPARAMTNIVDMGAGKGYLTFALYDYLNGVLDRPCTITGVECRKELVELCNGIAVQSGFERLHFVEGSIDSYRGKDTHVLIALHACDTATDDAIYQGIISNADLIVVAPCCHKQIRREMEKHKSSNVLDPLMKHGIFLERQAEMVTDGIRALIMEYHGYSTKVFEFISDAHTPKNVMIIGVRKHHGHVDRAGIHKKIQEMKAFFGIDFHYLEKAI